MSYISIYAIYLSNVHSALAGLNDASGEHADPASPPSVASSPPEVKSKLMDRSKSPLGKKTDENEDGTS